MLIKDEVDGDVEEETSGGTGGADLDPADQTLVGDAPRPDADVSAIPEISVSWVFCFGFGTSVVLLSILGFEFAGVFASSRFFFFRPFSFRFG